MNYKLNPKYMPYYAALVQAITLAYAGVHYFPGLWGWFIGVGVGSVISLSLAIASSKISEISVKRKTLARILYISLFILSPTTIALSIFAPASVFTAISWAASPDLAIALTGAIVGQGMVAKETAAKSEASEPLKLLEAKKATAHKVPCEWCGKPIANSQNARNAHASHCKVLQEAAKK